MRVAADTGGLMRKTLPWKVRPGKASTSKRSGWPLRMSGAFASGACTMNLSTVSLTTRNIGVPGRTKSPAPEMRSATAASKGARMRDRWTLRRATVSAASAAFTAARVWSALATARSRSAGEAMPLVRSCCWRASSCSAETAAALAWATRAAAWAASAA